MKKALVFFGALCSAIFFTSTLSAQELGYTFRAGLDFYRFLGPSESGPDGEELEDFGRYNTGFHVGTGILVKLTDLYGLKGELIFSQRGGRMEFEGPSYAILESEEGERLFSGAQRRQNINVTNAYIDIPLTAYARLGRLEFSAGAQIGFLVSSKASGETRYTEVAVATQSLPAFVSLDYNYFKDDLGAASFEVVPLVAIENGTVFRLPTTEFAYYDYTNDEGNFFQTLDFGLNAGVSLFLNEGLFVGYRLMYGLADVTNNDYDKSLSMLNEDDSFVPRSDNDRQLNMMMSLGFSF